MSEIVRIYWLEFFYSWLFISFFFCSSFQRTWNRVRCGLYTCFVLFVTRFSGLQLNFKWMEQWASVYYHSFHTLSKVSKLIFFNFELPLEYSPGLFCASHGAGFYRKLHQCYFTLQTCLTCSGFCRIEFHHINNNKIFPYLSRYFTKKSRAIVFIMSWFWKYFKIRRWKVHTNLRVNKTNLSHHVGVSSWGRIRADPLLADIQNVFNVRFFSQPA